MGDTSLIYGLTHEIYTESQLKGMAEKALQKYPEYIPLLANYYTVRGKSYEQGFNEFVDAMYRIIIQGKKSSPEFLVQTFITLKRLYVDMDLVSSWNVNSESRDRYFTFGKVRPKFKLEDLLFDLKLPKYVVVDAIQHGLTINYQMLADVITRCNKAAKTPQQIANTERYLSDVIYYGYKSAVENGTLNDFNRVKEADLEKVLNMWGSVSLVETGELTYRQHLVNLLEPKFPSIAHRLEEYDRTHM